MSKWTPQDDELLYQMWVKDGLSASLCAQRLNGRSRNSVIGQVFRKGWGRAKASAPTVKRPYPQRAAPKLQRRRDQPAPAFVRPGWRDGEPAAPTIILKSGAEIASANAKPWIEREPRECAYPISGTGADTVSCCNPASGPYCSPHAALMANAEGTQKSVSRARRAGVAQRDPAIDEFRKRLGNPEPVDIAIDPDRQHGKFRSRFASFGEEAA